MLIDRRFLFTSLAVAGLATKLAAAAEPAHSDVRIRHERHPYAPIAWGCIGWRPASGQRIYAIGVQYSDWNIELQGRSVVVQAEDFVRDVLTGPNRDRHIHAMYDKMLYTPPVFARDGSIITWEA